MTAHCGAVSQEQQQYFDWLSQRFLITRGFCRTWFTLAGQLFGAYRCQGGTPQWVFLLCCIGESWLAQCKQLSTPAKQWCQSADECYCTVRPSQYLETSASRFTTVPSTVNICPCGVALRAALGALAILKYNLVFFVMIKSQPTSDASSLEIVLTTLKADFTRVPIRVQQASNLEKQKKKTYIWNIKWKLILAMIHRILLRKCSPGSGLHVCTLSIVGLKQPKLHLSNNSKMNNNKTSLFFFNFCFVLVGFFFYLKKDKQIWP